MDDCKAVIVMKLSTTNFDTGGVKEGAAAAAALLCQFRERYPAVHRSHVGRTCTADQGSSCNGSLWVH